MSTECESNITKLNSNISYEYFYKNFMLKNIPCIFSDDLTINWKCRQLWVTSDDTPNFDLLTKTFGSAIVQIADCGQKYYNSNPKQDMCFADFVDYWRNVQINDYNYVENGLNIFYLKDWHFMRQFSDYNAYETPIYFESDWLNQYCDHYGKDDYRFVYMGPKNSWTPLHTDVFGSFSWSANICGRKKWILIPPGNEQSLKEFNQNKAVYDFTLVPDYCNKLKIMNGFEIIQNSGETIFIPSGWIHQVLNIDDCISINHNWFNACNISHVWNNIVNALNEVENELSDLKHLSDNNEWTEQCLNLLLLHHGIDIEQFVSCLVIVFERLRTQLSLSNVCSSKIYFRLKHELNVLSDFVVDNTSNTHLSRLDTYQNLFHQLIDFRKL